MYSEVCDEFYIPYNVFRVHSGSMMKFGGMKGRQRRGAHVQTFPDIIPPFRNNLRLLVMTLHLPAIIRITSRRIL